MRAVGMLRTGFILVFLIITYANTLPLQLLPSIPGYVPVYIRNGDEPLEDINLALAEAFAEHSSSKHLPNLKDSHIALEVQQPVDYEQVPHTYEESEKSTVDLFGADDSTGGKNNDLNLQTSLVKETVTPIQRRETNRSNGQKKSEAVTLEVNRSRIPQLLTAQEREDERTPDESDENNKKPIPIIVSEESENEGESGQVKEKDDVEKKQSIEADKSDFKPNELVDLNPNYPELPAEIPQQHNSQDFGSTNDSHQEGHPGSSSIIVDKINEGSESDELSNSSGEGEVVDSSKKDSEASIESSESTKSE